MVEVALSSAGILLAAIAGLKIAVFLVMAVYARLADIPFRKRGTYWLTLVSVSFILLALSEFFHFMGEASPEYIIWPWIMAEENISTVLAAANIVTGIGVLLFLLHINKNIQDYRSTFL